MATRLLFGHLLSDEVGLDDEVEIGVGVGVGVDEEVDLYHLPFPSGRSRAVEASLTELPYTLVDFLHQG